MAVTVTMTVAMAMAMAVVVAVCIKVEGRVVGELMLMLLPACGVLEVILVLVELLG